MDAHIFIETKQAHNTWIRNQQKEKELAVRCGESPTY